VHHCCAALLAQVLFVDNCVKEALDGVSHPDNRDTLTRLVRHIQDTYQAHQVPISSWRSSTQGKDVARVAYRGVEPSEAMKAVYRQNFLQRTGRAPLDTWEIATAGMEDFLEDRHRVTWIDTPAQAA
jgi:hypothetical protein